MRVCVPVNSSGFIDPRWGRADRVAIAEVASGEVIQWEEFDVGWSVLHGAGADGSHHGRVARFLRDHAVEGVVVDHMGQGMNLMLQRMQIKVWSGAGGDARHAVMQAASQ